MRNNLKKIRLTIGYNQQQMAEQLNMPLRTYMGYEYKAKVYPLDFIHKLSDILNVNIHFLYTGEGEMFISKTENTLIKTVNNNILTGQETFHKRFNKLQQTNNLNDFEISKILNIPESRIEKLGIGKSMPTLDELNSIKSNFDVSLDWLLYGETPYKSTQDKEQTLSAEEINQLKQLVKKFNV